MPSVDETRIVTVDGEAFDVVRVTPMQVTLVNRATGLTVVKRPAEVTESPTTFTLGRLRTMGDLTAQQRQRVDVLADHLQEVATGRWRNGEVRDGYDPSTTSQELRIARKLRELSDAGMSMSRATFYRKLMAWRADGRSALIDGRAARSFSPLERVPSEVLDALLDVLNETTHDSTRTRKWVINEVRRRFRRAGGDDAEFPSDASMYRYLHVLAEGRHLSAKATTRRSAANRPKRTFANRSPIMPGAEVQVDSTVLDVFVRTASGKVVRPTLTIMLDVATRMVLAFTFRMKAAKGTDQVYLLAQAMTPRENRPDITGVREELQSRMPNHSLLAPTEYRLLSTAQPYVRPRSITVDRGMDYMSSTFRAAAERTQCDVVLSAPRTPTSKPHVERMFGTINTRFAENLPGYTGGNPVDRGLRPEDDELLTIEMLWALFDDWLLRDYHNTPHSSLFDRQLPTRRISPLEAASVAVLDAAQFAPALGETFYIASLPLHWRAISDIGVTIDSRQYDSEDLHRLRNSRSPYPKQKGKWPVRMDPYNPDCVWVEVSDGKFVLCRQRGIEDRDLRPLWEPAEVDERALTAQFEASANGTPMPVPVPLPSYDTDEFEEDDLEFIDDFDTF